MGYLKINPKEYDKMVKKASPPTKYFKTLPAAFCVGGIICTMGEVFSSFYLALGLSHDMASGAASCSLVFLAAALTGLNVFDNIAAVAGAGTLVPITGFANAVASPALEFKTEGFILGVGAKMFIIAGPVIVYGLLASVIYGFIIYFFNMV